MPAVIGRALAVAPAESPPVWLVVAVAIVCVPLLVYLWVRLRRLRRPE